MIDDAVSFIASKPTLRELTWTLDHRPGLPDAAYDRFAVHLRIAFPLADVRVAVRHWHGGKKRGRLEIGIVRAKLKRITYLGAKMLSDRDAAAADSAAAAVILDAFTGKLRAILADYRAEKEDQ